MLELTSNNKKIYKTLDDEGFVKDVKLWKNSLKSILNAGHLVYAKGICGDAILSVDIYDGFIPSQAAISETIFNSSETQVMPAFKLDRLQSVFSNSCKGVWIKKDESQGYLTLVVN